jgi:hypothetical protein
MDYGFCPLCRIAALEAGLAKVEALCQRGEELAAEAVAKNWTPYENVRIADLRAALTGKDSP